MSNFNFENLGPVAGTPFEPIVAETIWQDQELPPRLRVTAGLGNWLVGVDEGEQVTELLGYSIEDVDNTGVLFPPKDLDEVRRRITYRLQVGLFNTDWTAKGLGSTMANIPPSLQPNSVHGRVAVRSVALMSEADMYRRPETDTPVSQKMRIARHAGLLGLSTTRDKLTHSDRGTLAAIRYMEKGYDDARLVFAPAPPIWQKQQQAAGIVPPIHPGIVLVRGGSFTESNPMRFVGSYSTNS